MYSMESNKCPSDPAVGRLNVTSYRVNAAAVPPDSKSNEANESSRHLQNVYDENVSHSVILVRKKNQKNSDHR